MNTGHQITIEFAEQQPQRFASVLDRAIMQDRGAVSEIIDVVAEIPPATAAAVASSLAPNTLRDLAHERAPMIAKWLSEGNLDHAMAMLARLPRAQALELVDQVSRTGLRRRLRQFLNYPAHTVGGFVMELDLQLDANASLADALSQMRAAAEPTERAVVVDAQGKYLGVLDIWAVAVRDSDEAQPLHTVMRKVPPLRAETPVSEAAWVEAWTANSWLPVVDHDDRVLGWASRSRLLNELAGEVSETAEMGGAVANVFNSMLKVFVDLLTRILLPRGSA